MADKIKKTLNDTNIAALKAAPKGTRYDAWDIGVAGLSVRVTDSGSKTYCLTAKLITEKTARRFTIDPVGKITLDTARKTARDWLVLIDKGQDPRIVVPAQRADLVQEVAADKASMFRNVIASYLAIKKPDVKPDSYGKIDYYLNDCCAEWADRQIGSISTKEITGLVKAVSLAGKRGAARALVSAIKSVFAEAASNGHMTSSAAASIITRSVAGKKGVRERPLTEVELKKVWDAAPKLDQPFCEIARMLILTGCRRSEVSHASWSEIVDGVWTIPAKRMKMNKAHAIPLTPMMLAVLKTLKKGAKGDYIFSVTDGKTPRRFCYRTKAKLNKLVGFSDWVNHDLRHTVRTMSEAIGIAPHIAEQMIAHTKAGNYNHHTYLNEKREAFLRWNAEVARIVGGSKVMPFKRAA